MSAGGVKISQQRAVPFVDLSLGLVRLLGIDPLRIDHIANGILDAQLGVSVRVGRSRRARFGNGDHVGETSGIAVDGGRAGKDNIVHVMLHHGFEEVERSNHIDPVVFQWDFRGFSDRLVRTQLSVFQFEFIQVQFTE